MLKTSPFLVRTRGGRTPALAFTLVEIMIVVLVIGGLAMLAQPALRRHQLRTRASIYWNDVRVFSEAFARYAHERGAFPPAAEVSGGFPKALAGYMSETRWSRVSPIGGRYAWVLDASSEAEGGKGKALGLGNGKGNAYAYGLNKSGPNDGGAVIEVNGATLSMAEHLQLDGWFDDGNLTTGSYQVTDAGFTVRYIIERL